jgi:hypothetical protein
VFKLDTLLLKQKNLPVLDIYIEWVSFSAFVLRWQPWCYAPRPSTEYSCGKRPTSSNRLYLDISRSSKCPKSSPAVCLICYYLRLVVFVLREYILKVWNKRICPYWIYTLNGFLFPHSYSGDSLGATHLGLQLSTHAEKETIDCYTFAMADDSNTT